MRKLKPQQVTDVRDAGHIVPIMLDRNELTFFGEFNGVTYRGKTAEEAKGLLLRAIKTAIHVDWIPIIKVEVVGQTRDSFNNSDLGLIISRDYYAKMPDGSGRVLDWEAYEVDPASQFNRHDSDINSPNYIETKRLRSAQRYHGDFDAPWNDGCSNWRFAYDPDLWAGLEAITKGITTLREKLMELLAGKTGVQTIKMFGASKPKALEWKL